MTARFLSCQPDAPDGRRWLVLAEADVAAFPGCGPVLVVESSHDRRADASRALDRANAGAPAPDQGRDGHGAQDAREPPDADAPSWPGRAAAGPLPPCPNLPPEWRACASVILACPERAPDALLAFADALDEAVALAEAASGPESPGPGPLVRLEARALAAEMRRRAPERAGRAAPAADAP